MVLTEWKSTGYVSPGNSLVFGTADINKISRLLNGEPEVAAVEIDSDFALLQNRLKLRGVDNVNDVTLNADPSQAANVTLLVPLLTADDTLMTLGGVQTLAGKAFNISTNT